MEAYYDVVYRQKVLGIKMDMALERDIQKACGGICSKSKFVKQAVLKELAMRKELTIEAANRTIGVDGYKTLNYVQNTDDDKVTGIVTIYDQTGSFVTHILVPFHENGKTFYRDQNGYKWEDDDDEGPNPVFTDDGECKETPSLPRQNEKAPAKPIPKDRLAGRKVHHLDDEGSALWSDCYDANGKFLYRQMLSGDLGPDSKS